MFKFPVFDVTDWVVTDVEPEGDDLKYWLLGSASEPAESSWLYKQATAKQVRMKEADGGGLRQYVRGESWTEKVCAELAAVLGMPAARTELAMRDGVTGSLSKDVRPDGWSLTGGGVLIGEVDARYRPKTSADPRRNRIGHNLVNIQRVLSAVATPPGWPSGGRDAWDFFSGYLVLDAWLANRDRHEQNWAVLQDPGGQLYLSPSFDHGAALGSGLEDAKRTALLHRSAVPTWCGKATAHRFEDRGGVTLVDLAAEATSMGSAEAHTAWVNVSDITRPEWQAVLSRIPELSEATATFVDEVLYTNQERIRDAYRSL